MCIFFGVDLPKPSIVQEVIDWRCYSQQQHQTQVVVVIKDLLPADNHLNAWRNGKNTDWTGNQTTYYISNEGQLSNQDGHSFFPGPK